MAEGVGHESAYEYALARLYKGLVFSRYETVYHILLSEYPALDPEPSGELVREAVSYTDDIFDRYPTGDDFRQSPSYKALVLELTGAIREFMSCEHNTHSLK